MPQPSVPTRPDATPRRDRRTLMTGGGLCNRDLAPVAPSWREIGA
ncbi:hypothetical protein [Novacetimonas cocois]|nr:hypothetical protein [Novacetimonas cocois]